MSPIEIVATLVTLTALAGYLNERFIRLPPTIGVTLGGLLVSLVLVALGTVGFDGRNRAAAVLATIPFDRLLMEGLLGVLLFAGALHIDVRQLMRQKWPILLLSTVGILISTFVVGTLVYGVARALSLPLSYSFALLFGALISPTDPVAVLSLLKRARVSRELEVVISGESLFNDGVGVVVFVLVASLTAGGHVPTFAEGVRIFLHQAVGGILFGLALGWVGFELLRRVDHFTVEIMLTLALVVGGYTLAGRLHTSGPLAIVVAGIVVGNPGRAYAMSGNTWAHLDTFWLVLDEMLNAILFMLIGLEVLALPLSGRFLLAAGLAVAATLLARWVSVVIPLRLMHRRWRFAPYTVRILTWGGLRGGIAIALALSLPASPERALVLVMTYAVVVFSILVQGLTIESLALRAAAHGAPAGPAAGGS